MFYVPTKLKIDSSAIALITYSCTIFQSFHDKIVSLHSWSRCAAKFVSIILCNHLQVLEVQLPGKKVVNAAAFWNGLRGQKLKKLRSLSSH